MSDGRVHLVGAGPGDPGLLTLRAAQVLATADVVVYDHLVADAILDRLPAHVERVYAGKETGSHTMNQAAINALLEERARRGQRVVRLKGGDPFVFGRGGEEAEYLAARGISFDVVPGITAAVGVPAYAGIPVTHRGVAASFAVVTGRAGPVGEAADVEWARIAGADTIVVLMGVANHESVVQTLIESGRSPDTPVAAIRWGTTAHQHVVLGTLATIGARVRAEGVRPPAILVVGAVVSLVPALRWVERRPLHGRRVLVPAAYPSPLTSPLEELGAEVLHAPPVEIGAPSGWQALDDALDRLPQVAGIIVGDDIGVDALVTRLGARGRDVRALAAIRVVAWAGTAVVRLAARGLRADRVIEETDIDPGPGASGSQAWLVLGAPDVQALIGEELARRGLDATMPEICSCVAPKWRADRLREVLTTRPAHAAAFMDSFEVGRLVAALDLEERRLLERLALAATGKPTARALRALGLSPTVEVDEDAPVALAQALAAVMLVGRPGDRD